jgi:flagellar motor switch protein FliM
MMEQKEEILTSEEMSALLPGVSTDEAARERERRRRVVPYNFRRPDRLSKEQVRSLYLLHDLFAHTLTSSLPLFMRAVSEVNLISVDQQSYGDYLRGLSDPTTIFTIAANSLKGVFAVEINSSIAFPVIDRMLGGEGKELDEVRPATDLELKILEGFVSVVTDNYREVWGTIVELDTEIAARETRPQLLQIVPPNEIVAAVVYQVQIGDAKGLMSICLPVVMLEPIIDQFNKSSYSSDSDTPPEATLALLNTIAAVNFEVSAELEETASALSDLMELAAGDILRTNHSIEKPVNVAVADNVKFIGRLASLEGRMVVQVLETNQKKVSTAG